MLFTIEGAAILVIVESIKSRTSAMRTIAKMARRSGVNRVGSSDFLLFILISPLLFIKVFCPNYLDSLGNPNIQGPYYFLS